MIKSIPAIILEFLPFRLNADPACPVRARASVAQEKTPSGAELSHLRTANCTDARGNRCVRLDQGR